MTRLEDVLFVVKNGKITAKKWFFDKEKCENVLIPVDSVCLEFRDSGHVVQCYRSDEE